MADAISTFAATLERAAHGMQTISAAKRLQADAVLRGLRLDLLRQLAASAVLADVDAAELLMKVAQPCLLFVQSSASSSLARFYAACFLSAIVARFRLPLSVSISAASATADALRQLQYQLVFVIAPQQSSRPVVQQLLAASARLLVKSNLRSLSADPILRQLRDLLWGDVYSAWDSISQTTNIPSMNVPARKGQLLLYFKAILDQFAKLGQYQFAARGGDNDTDENFSGAKSEILVPPWNIYRRCKRDFEVTEMVQLLQRGFQELYKVHHVLSTTSQSNSEAIDRKQYEETHVALVVHLVEAHMSWDFDITSVNFNSEGSSRSTLTNKDSMTLTSTPTSSSPSSTAITHFPIEWQSLLLSNEVPDILFKLLVKLSHLPVVSHRLHQCILHLCALPTSPSFFLLTYQQQQSSTMYTSSENDHRNGAADKVRYAQLLLQGLLLLFTDGNLVSTTTTTTTNNRDISTHTRLIAGPHLTALCDMAHSLVRHFKVIPTLVSCGDLLLRFLEHLATLTAHVLAKPSHNSMAESEQTHSNIEVDDTWRDEASDELIAMWSQIVYQISLTDVDAIYNPTNITLPHFNFIAFKANLCRITNDLFTAYMSSKVTFHGHSLHNSDNNSDDDDSDSILSGGDGFKDWVTYEDKLFHVATLARFDSQASLSILVDTFNTLLVYLRHYLQSNGTVTTLLCSVPTSLWESLHWTLIVIAFVLADPSDGESPLVSRQLVNALGTSSSVINRNKETGQNTQNLLVRLPQLVFELLDMLAVTSSSNLQTLAACVSPQVVETLWWMLQRWTASYLFLNPDNYTSSSFSVSWRNNDTSNSLSPCTDTFVLSPEIRQAYVALPLSTTIEEQQNRTGPGALLDFLVQRLTSQYAMWASEENVLHQHLVQQLLTNLIHLPESLHCRVVEVLTTVVINASHNPSLRAMYFEHITGAVAHQIKSILHHPMFQQQAQDQHAMASVLTCLEMLNGLALCIEMFNPCHIYVFLSQYLNMLVDLMRLYSAVPELAIYVLVLLSTISKNQDLEQLSESEMQQLMSVITEVLKQYSTAHAGRKSYAATTAATEDERHRDMLVVLELLSYLVSSDFETCGREEKMAAMDQPTQSMKYLSDGVFASLEMILPLITNNVMSLPSISIQCTTLIALVFRFHPQRVSQLSPNLLDAYISLIRHALQHSQIRAVNVNALDAITCLAIYARHQVLRHESVSPSLNSVLDLLLQVLLHVLLDEDFRADLFEELSEAFATVIVARQTTFMQLVHHRIAAEPEPQMRDVLTRTFTELTTTLEQPGIADRVLSTSDVQRFSAVLWTSLTSFRGAAAQQEAF